MRDLRGVRAPRPRLGINFIDTANAYGRGAAESFLGEHPARTSNASRTCWPPRCSSRCRRPTAAYQPSRSTSSATRRCNGCAPTTSTSTSATATTETPLEETMGALTEQVEKGKARYIGFSEWTPSRSRRLEVPGSRSASCRASRSTRCCGAARGRAVRPLRGQRHRSDRLVPARPGRAHRQVPAGLAPAPGSRAASE